MSVFVAKELCHDRVTSSVDHQAIAKYLLRRQLGSSSVSLGNTTQFLPTPLGHDPAHHNGAMSPDLLYSVIPS